MGIVNERKSERGRRMHEHVPSLFVLKLLSVYIDRHTCTHRPDHPTWTTEVISDYLVKS